jgi:transcription elongation factor Elf1
MAYRRIGWRVMSLSCEQAGFLPTYYTLRQPILVESQTILAPWSFPWGSSCNGGQLPFPAKSSLLVAYDQKTGLDCSSIRPKKTKKNDTMTKLVVKQEVPGTRTGYVIRFTCPSCLHDNAIINKTPKECYRETRDATCHQCKKRSTVLTPGMYEKKVYSPV